MTLLDIPIERLPRKLMMRRARSSGGPDAKSDRHGLDESAVTMPERGVSQLVSVDLEGAVKMREAV